MDTIVAKSSIGRRSRDSIAVDRLVEEAEGLFGQHGIDGVSMRQIQLAAGSSNNFVVQYHFGGIAGLVRAILEKRMPAVDARQATLLARAEAAKGAEDTRTLVDILFRPVLEQVNDRGERNYARFISALLRSPDGRMHCRTLFHLTPTTVRLLDMLHNVNVHLPRPVLEERLRLLSGMVYTSLFNRLVTSDVPEADARLIDDTLDVAAAGLIVAPRSTRTSEQL